MGSLFSTPKPPPAPEPPPMPATDDQIALGAAAQARRDSAARARRGRYGAVTLAQRTAADNVGGNYSRPDIGN